MNTPRILIVEDEPINLQTLSDNLAAEGYETSAATTGEKAWQMISEAPERYTVILLDRVLPDMDGIEILHRMKGETRLAHTPVIMQSALNGTEHISEGLRAGAFYYLTKPFSSDMLTAIVSAAAGDHQEWLALRNEVRTARSTLTCLREARFAFRTPEEARNIAVLLANAAPQPDRAVVGLSELMLNAVEHGNLAITYDEKSALIADGTLHDEIERRLTLPEYAGREATLSFVHGENHLELIIRDEGAGFEWQKYLVMSPERAFDTHGRGIVMSKSLCFDSLEYQGCGNEVHCRIVC